MSILTSSDLAAFADVERRVAMAMINQGWMTPRQIRARAGYGPDKEVKAATRRIRAHHARGRTPWTVVSRRRGDVWEYQLIDTTPKTETAGLPLFERAS